MAFRRNFNDNQREPNQGAEQNEQALEMLRRGFIAQMNQSENLVNLQNMAAQLEDDVQTFTRGKRK